MPYSTTHSTDFFTVRQLKPNRALVLFWDSHLRFLVPKYSSDDPTSGAYGELTWTLTLKEEVEGHTRPVLRTRAKYEPRPYQALNKPVLPVGGDVFTTRKTLYGIKRRAERLGRELVVG